MNDSLNAIGTPRPRKLKRRCQASDLTKETGVPQAGGSEQANGVIGAVAGSALSKSDGGPGRQRVWSERVLAAAVGINRIPSVKVQRIKDSINGGRIAPDVDAKIFRVRVEGKAPVKKRCMEGHKCKCPW
jgi:hypothetical protein